MHLKMLSAYVICCTYLPNISVEANSVDPDQTAPTGAVCSGSTLFNQEASLTFQQTTKADNLVVVIGALTLCVLEKVACFFVLC